jgi:heme/copper-type cytochrome/quinol oxidase subunit 2
VAASRSAEGEAKVSANKPVEAVTLIAVAIILVVLFVFAVSIGRL